MLTVRGQRKNSNRRKRWRDYAGNDVISFIVYRTYVQWSILVAQFIRNRSKRMFANRIVRDSPRNGIGIDTASGNCSLRDVYVWQVASSILFNDVSQCVYCRRASSKTFKFIWRNSSLLLNYLTKEVLAFSVKDGSPEIRYCKQCIVVQNIANSQRHSQACFVQFVAVILTKSYCKCSSSLECIVQSACSPLSSGISSLSLCRIRELSLNTFEITAFQPAIQQDHSFAAQVPRNAYRTFYFLFYSMYFSENISLIYFIYFIFYIFHFTYFIYKIIKYVPLLLHLL